MIFIILMSNFLPCSVCETFEVRSAQSSYQVSKNEDVTLEWTFSNSSLDSLVISCFVLIDHHPSVLLEYDKGFEIPQYGVFRGRVQLDKDLLRERRIRLHVSSLRTEDSGDYQCEVSTSEGSGWASARVNVTAELQTTPQTKTETEPGPEDRKSGSGVGIGLIFGLLTLVICVFGIFLRHRYTRKPLHLCCYRAETEGHSADRISHEVGHEGVSLNQIDETCQI